MLPLKLVGYKETISSYNKPSYVIHGKVNENMGDLSLFEKESTSLILPNMQHSSEFILVTSFLTSVLNMEAIMRTFKQLWHSTSGLKIKNWRKFMSNVTASPFMLVEGDNNLDTTEVQANMETENSGGEFNANNSSKLNTSSVTYVTLLVTSLAQDSSNSIPQHLHSLNTNITQLDANFLSKLVEIDQDIRKFEQVPSKRESMLL